MSGVVFVLGAGASAEAGCPVMKNFLDRSRELALLGGFDQFEDDYRRVNRFQTVLQRAHAKSTIDIENIESVFTAVEMGIAVGGLPDLPEKDLLATRRSLLRLIVGTLQSTQLISIQRHPESRGAFHCGPNGYKQFANLVNDIKRSKVGHSVGIITFNYDVGLEIALGSNRIPIAYSLTEPPASDAVPVCKLHGSVNWYRSQDSEARVSTWSAIEAFDAQLGREDVSTPTHFDVQRVLDAKGVEPLIVPPSESKAEGRSVLKCVWTQAFKMLSAAEVVVVIGYSLPDTDLFFRQFFALASISDTIIREFWLIDPEPPLQRFQMLLRSTLESKQGRFPHPYSGRFVSGIEDFAKQFRESGWVF